MAVRILISEAAVAARVAELGAAIRRDAGEGAALHLIGVLKGSFVFMADLMRAIDGPVTCDFMAVSSYAGSQSSGTIKLVKDLDKGLEGRRVLVVEDIVDTGLTLSYILDSLRSRQPQSLATVCLLDKPSRRKVDVTIDYVGFSVPDLFLVGYGLDVDDMHRNLRYVGVVEEGAAS